MVLLVCTFVIAQTRVQRTSPPPTLWRGESPLVLAVWTELCVWQKSSGIYIAQHLTYFSKQNYNSRKKSSHISPTPSGSSPKTLQISFPNDLAFLTFVYTNRMENLQSRRRFYMKNGSYPIGFEILFLNVPDLGEPSRERRTDLGHDIFRCQRASDVFQRGRFQFRDLQSYVKRNSGPDLVLASIMKWAENTHDDKAYIRSSRSTWARHRSQQQAQTQQLVTWTSIRLPRSAKRTIGGANRALIPSSRSDSN